MNQQLNTIKDAVMKRIESGATKMRPRWQFVLRSILIAAGAILAALSLLFFISLALFSLRQSCAFCLPAFGGPGIRLFFTTVPWMLVFLSFVFLLILELFVRRYPIAYKKPIVYSVLAVAFLGAVGGYAVAKTGIHPMFYRATFERGVPGVPISQKLYRHYGAPNLKNIFPGTIILGEAGALTIETPTGNVFTISVTPDTQIPLGAKMIVGDRVVVIGDVSSSGTIQAIGIRPLPTEGVFVPMHIKRIRGVPSSSSTEPIEVRYLQNR